MKLTNFSNYAMRSLMFAEMHQHRLVQVQEVASAFNISKTHLVKCVHQLGQWGFIESVRGRNGGFRLARPAEKIFVGQVIRKTEDTLELVECFNDQTNSCPLISQCKLSRALKTAMAAFLAELDALSLADITDNKMQLHRLLEISEDNE